MDFQAVAKSHHVRAPRKEMRILASRPSIQMCAQDIFPTGSKNFPDSNAEEAEVERFYEDL